MKIEKINDNQIRCTLTRADLASRQLQLSELAYGTEKAKSLFHDMMQQAAFEFGFEAEDIPLMIEAIPASADSIVLIITKVENPEELDARFSRFSPSADEDWTNENSLKSDKLEGAENLMDYLGKVKDKTGASPVPTKAEAINTMGLHLFSFASLDSVTQAAKLLENMYSGSNTLYKDNREDIYILAITQSELTTNAFNRICNMLSEFGTLEKSGGATLAYLEEHCQVIIAADAIKKLAAL
ncbi:adapter protein MecA 1/2 [Lachnospiraceae bacterium PF1-21]|uniref:Adaptor protein MecA n=1 Tax=Ohessyouella blattaphilus TaxID=2949333 RepID=A0ABT1EH69_9FIRM|nr:adaptor protein MecA [Ohessyouella blattaphilus]MCP1110033.1 adaptor protein MecA [Ohessyouella blattaphilus]MCR8563427.1 adaptor protein MecA [Ohessyouella blattaphilus]MDL2249169.1 adaptor protein MecA [Lachnospiraceae bacterium OttesenSCG-928-J05]